MRFLRRLSFFETESFAGLLLLAAAILALIIANSSWHEAYTQTLSRRLGPFDLAGWINDGLMAFFFFVVGLEIKAELLHGSLSTRDRALLPVISAIGGMIVPAVVYLSLQHDRGWGIPMATDIAFAVGVLSLFKVAPQLKIFLLALAIVDDLGAILVIAVFYTTELHWMSLLFAAAAAVGAYLVRARGLLFALLGVALWWFVHESGVHATIAGCLLGFLAPKPVSLAKTLHPWSAYLVMPLFALANAGVSIRDPFITTPLINAISLGLLIGKPLGIVGASWLAIRMKWARADFSMREFIGVACLGGIGFTMSIFIAGLAFDDVSQLEIAKLGIVRGSLLSAALGAILLTCSARAARIQSSKRSSTP
jgi:NhaA family Na+:H+ antiporter